MRRHASIVQDQLSDKHRQMAGDLICFMRGTFFRWAQAWSQVCADEKRAPKVLAVGDLHIASFGTWRDKCGRLVWGIDDFDEAYPLPYTNDLVRLAVSAALDSEEGDLSVRTKNVCDLVLEGYREGLKSGGRPFVLEESHKWLRKLALDHLDLPWDFWRTVDGFPASRSPIPDDAERALRKALPADVPFRVRRRIAGVGSLGHPRYVGVADWCGGQLAIEAKAAIPSACGWANSSASNEIYYQRALDCAVRSTDPFVKLDGKWLIRRLAPDSAALEIESLGMVKEEEKLLHAMAWEAANIHLGSAPSSKRILDDLNRRSAKWLKTAVKEMAHAMIADWKTWKKAVRAKA
jgi:Uncharacterized protein conserved in bacteria (DUF2252)